MTDHRLGKTFTPAEIADYAYRFQEATGVVPNACRHHWEIIDHEPETQSRTPEETRDFFSDNPDVTLAVKTGPLTGLTALLTRTPGEGIGLHSLHSMGWFCWCEDVLTEIRSETEAGLTIQHLLLFRSGDQNFHGGMFSKLPGVLLIRSGEYVPIAPGYTASCHPKCPSIDYSYGFGRDYVDHAIPPLPVELVDLLALERAQSEQRERVKNAPTGVRAQLFDPISEGNRNNELTRRAGYLIGAKKMSADEALDVLQTINRECCQPPLDVREVAGIVKSISRRHARNG